MKLNERISNARKEKGLTQEELADLANVTTRTIQRIEYGESIPRSYTLKAIARALDLTYEELVTAKATQQPEDIAQQPEEAAHFIKMLNLSCFSYLVIPWIHFLIPIYLLKKQRNIGGDALTISRKIIRQQMYWVAALQLLMLLTFAYNYIQAMVNGHYIAHYLWPFLFMYLLNAGLILYNNQLIQTQLKLIDPQSLSCN